MKRLRGVLAVIAGAFAVGIAWAAPQVDVFTPQGQAKGVRQVAVRFTEPMVAFGDPRLSDPFTVRCDGDAERLKGRGRWADPNNWVYDFEADLPAGQRCRFTLIPGLKSAAGEAVDGTREFSFHTGGPAVMTSLPREGGGNRRRTGVPACPRRAGGRREPGGGVVRGRGHQRAHPAQAAVRPGHTRHGRGQPRPCLQSLPRLFQGPARSDRAASRSRTSVGATCR